MPIKIPEDLPARPILEGENIFVMTEGRANRQDIRPLEIAIVNLMPTKIATETQLARLLGFAPGYPEEADRKYFDLRSGIFVAEKPLHNYYLTPAHAAPFFALGDPEKSPDFAHEKDYLNLWHILMTYFSLHIEGFQRPRSLEFLQQLTRIEYFPPKE